MNSKFPLLKPPLLGFETVLTTLEIPELIHLSFSSKRLVRLIKALRLKMGRFLIIVRNDQTALNFNYESPNRRGGWSFNHKNYPKSKKSRRVTASINGMEIRSFLRDNWIHSHTTGNIPENIKTQIDYLKQLVRFPVPDVNLFPDDMPEWKHPILLRFNECRNLSIQGKKELKEEVMNKILQSYSVKDRLFMQVPTNSTFTLDNLQWKLPKRIYIKESAHWITADVLHHSKFNHMLLVDCKLTARDFIQFVERWLSSDDKNFEYLHFIWENEAPQEEINQDDLGVEMKEFDPKRRSRSFPCLENFAWDLSTGQDFERKDGVLASIVLNTDVALFCVFHERFPNLGNARVLRP